MHPGNYEGGAGLVVCLLTFIIVTRLLFYLFRAIGAWMVVGIYFAIDNGFAAQTTAFARIAKRDIPLLTSAALSPAELSEHLRKHNLLVVANTKSGETFYFGDLINGYLVPQVTNDYSLWNFAAAAAIEAGVKPAELPDCNAMFRHAAQTVGSPEYGVLRSRRSINPT